MKNLIFLFCFILYSCTSKYLFEKNVNAQCHTKPKFYLKENKLLKEIKEESGSQDVFFYTEMNDKPDQKCNLYLVLINSSLAEKFNKSNHLNIYSSTAAKYIISELENPDYYENIKVNFVITKDSDVSKSISQIIFKIKISNYKMIGNPEMLQKTTSK